MVETATAVNSKTFLHVLLINEFKKVEKYFFFIYFFSQILAPLAPLLPKSGHKYHPLKSNRFFVLIYLYGTSEDLRGLKLTGTMVET